LKKNLLLWGSILVFLLLVSLITAPKLDFGSRLLCSLVLSAIGWIGIKLNIGKKSNTGSSETPSNNEPPRQQIGNRKYIYIFRNTEPKFLYRFDGKYVYSGMSDKFIYRVEGNQIFKEMDSKFTYRIYKNKIYKGLDRKPLYRIIGNCIYSGEFGEKPVFRISYSKSL